MDIAERLKSTRKARNLSVYKLSQLSGVSETHIRDLERGDRNPSFDTLHRLVKPLGVISCRSVQRIRRCIIS